MRVLARLLLALGAIAGCLFLTAVPASAHPLGNFTVNRYTGILVSPDGIEIDHVVDLAEIPTAQLGTAIDDLPALAERECATTADGLDVQAGGSAVRLALESSSASLTDGVGGLPIARITCAYSGAADTGEGEITFTDSTSPGSVGWREVTAVGDRMTLALDYYFKALKMAEQLGDKDGIATHLGNIGIIYSNQHDYPKALDYYFKALKMAEQLGGKDGIARQLHSIGVVYAETGKFLEAEEYLKKSIAIADSIGALDYLMKIEETLSQVYDTTGRYKLALEHYKKAMVLKDSLFNQEKNKEITRKEMNYEFEKTQAAEKAGHEKQLAVAGVEIKKQKVLKYSFIGSLALTILLFFFSYRFYNAQQVLRLQTIRNKISGDLHDDIGSTLNSISIYSEVAKKKDEQQDEALEMIGDASRKIIDAMSDIVWTINPENDSFAKIIFRMKSLAYNLFRSKNIEFTFQSDDILNEKKLSIEERRNLYLIFKEAVNNLIKYSNATHAAITLINENDHIKLRIQDDGVGFDISQDMEGNGLKSMKRRADEMKAQFKLESSKGNGTQIELILKA